jgi:hypothetical protein
MLSNPHASDFRHLGWSGGKPRVRFRPAASQLRPKLLLNAEFRLGATVLTQLLKATMPFPLLEAKGRLPMESRSVFALDRGLQRTLTASIRRCSEPDIP